MNKTLANQGDCSLPYYRSSLLNESPIRGAERDFATPPASDSRSADHKEHS
jgi:hypothetical protein